MPGRRPLLLWLLLGRSRSPRGLALCVWSASPYARYLDHGGWADAASFAALCRAIPQGEIVVPALLHALAWVLMIAAMMLPTTFPVLALFQRVVRERPDGCARLVASVVAGFIAAWMTFGLVAHAADTLLHAAVAGDPVARRSTAWVIGAVVLAGAGAFQFSALKYRCLERAIRRSPSSRRAGTGGRRRARRCGSASTTASSASAAAGR